MDNEDDEYCFNEEKARKCVYYLLKNDSPSFKKFIPEIKVMDSDSFENLFQGTPFKNKNEKEDEDEGYDYKVKNKKQFEKLLDKFDNFSLILEDWYRDEKYYEYLKELWVKYISIENLKERDDKKLEELLKANNIDYINWPEDIKDDFKTKINNTSKTRIMAIKSIIENDLSEYNKVIQELTYYRNTINNKKKEEENKIYEINARNIIKRVLGSALIFAIGKAFNMGLKAVDEKEIKALKKYILNNNKVGLNQSKVNSLVERLLETIEGESETKIHKIYKLREGFSSESYFKNPADCYWYSDGTLNFEDEIGVYGHEGKLNYLNLDQRAKAFFKSKAVCGMHAALSFLNLVWSIAQLKKTCDGFKEVKQYEIRLNGITKEFNDHKKSIGILPDDSRESSKKIKEVLSLIWEDYKKIELLIKDINNSILSQERQQKQAILGTGASVILGAVGAAGSILTCNITSAFYATSTVWNVVSGICDASSFILSRKIVKELSDIRTKAEKQSKEIQKEIDNLFESLKKTGGEIAKFDLSESFSSISTNE